jgi:hypothetical protein
MVGAIPAVPVMKDLVVARSPLKLNHVDSLHVRPLAGCRARVNGFNGDALLEQVELIHGSAAS